MWTNSCLAAGAEMLMSELSERTSELATLQQELVNSSSEVRQPACLSCSCVPRERVAAALLQGTHDFHRRQ